eukprot:Nitzschia sp. Nitz4//scaffold139_size61406//15313//16182//NITZ4_006450-RA/size61406-processed-gene-0.51-mRNA-1//1//CDS//3329535822//1976//frame0
MTTPNDSEATQELPKISHPTAKAFFDALDTKKASSRQSANLQQLSRSLGWRNRHSQSDQYPLQVLDQTITVRQHQRGEVEGTYGTGATVWPAAVVLIKYFERHPDWLKGQRIVDLGSGTGITSLAAAILGASHVVCTDGEESVVQLARDNIAAMAEETKESVSDTNNTTTTWFYHTCPIQAQFYWWGTLPLPDPNCDIVIVADCVLPKLYPIAPLVQAIDELLTKPTSRAILSYEHRWYPDYDPRDEFRRLACERGLVVDSVPLNDMDPVYAVDDIEIWHVVRGGDNNN